MEDVAKAASNHHWGEGYLEINWGWANMRKHVRATQSLEIKHLWFECLNFSVISSCFHKNPHHGKGLINQSGRRDVSEFSPYLGMAPIPSAYLVVSSIASTLGLARLFSISCAGLSAVTGAASQALQA